jgi:hypothetical protein
MEEPRFHPLDYLSVVKRRKWWLIVPLALAIVVGTALAIFLPREYLSSTTIGVTSPSVEAEASASTVKGGVTGCETVSRATGGSSSGATWMLCVAGVERFPPVSAAITLTVYVPAAA